MKIMFPTTTGLRIILYFSLFAIIVSCGQKSNEGTDLTDERRDLIRYYHTMKNTGLNGDVSAFLDMRDSVTNREVLLYFNARNWIIDSTRVSEWTKNWPDISSLTLITDTIDGRWRKLVFKITEFTNNQDKPAVAYAAVLFGLNGETWKVSNATKLMSPKFNPDGSKFTLSEYSFPRIFRIPPDFQDLRKPPEGQQGTTIIKDDAIPIE